MEKLIQLQSAVQIGDYILAQMNLSEERAAIWPCEKTTASGARVIDWGIEQGHSGLLLFLLELYADTQEQRFRQAALAATTKLLRSFWQAPLRHYGLLNGRSGLAWLCLRLHQLTEDPQWLAAAGQLLDDSLSFINSTYATNGLFDGRAGLLLVLSHYYTYRPEPSIQRAITAAYNKICHSAYLTKAGVFWDFDQHCTGGLCGLGRGASGIALAMAQSGQNLNIHKGQFLIRWALDYERSQWQAPLNNWANHYYPIKDVATEQRLRQAYVEQSLEAVEPPEALGWELGFIGSWLVRQGLRPFVEGEPELGEELDRCMVKARSLLMEDWNLSLLDLGMLGQALKGHPSDPAMQAAIAQQLDATELPAQRLGLRNGWAGLGYAKLRLQAEPHSDTHLMPFLSPPLQSAPESTPFSILQDHEIGRELLSRQFSRLPLLYMILTQNNQWLKDMLDICKYQHTPFLPAILKAIENHVNTHPEDPKMERLQDLLELEKQQFETFTSAVRPMHAYIKQYFDFETAEALMKAGDEALLDQHYVIAEEVCLQESRWDWSMTQSKAGVAFTSKAMQNFTESADEHFALCRFDYNRQGLVVKYLDGLALVLLHFEEPERARTILESMLEESEFTQAEQIQLCKDSLLKLLIQALQEGLIKPVAPPAA